MCPTLFANRLFVCLDDAADKMQATVGGEAKSSEHSKQGSFPAGSKASLTGISI